MARTLATATIVLALAAHAAAQPGSRLLPTVEVWVGPTVAVGEGGGTLTTSYSPPLLLDGAFSGHAAQTISADAHVASGLSVGVNVFPTKHVGVQILVDRVSRDVSGVNTPYSVSLRYTTRLPPDDTPQSLAVDRTVQWPDTTGSRTELVIAFNAVVRAPLTDRVWATVSGGPTYARVTGTIAPVAFSAFHLGGHGVLFDDEYRLGMALDPTHRVGFNAGVDVNVSVARRIAVFVAYRFFATPEADVAVAPDAILNPADISMEQPLSAIQSALSGPQLRVATGGSRIAAGVKLHFR